MDELLKAWREFDALRNDDDIRRGALPLIEPEYDTNNLSERLGERVKTALIKQGRTRLYRHQAEAVKQALDGKNVVLQAPTASGKTLAFQIPMIEALTQPKSHALMLYPTKALAYDQREQLRQFTDAMPGTNIESFWYDGDTEREHRELLRKTTPNILITNPDMLHNSFLDHSEQWSKFYRGLKWVIVDEIHEYRGYFGSQVAMILRRFSYHLASHGIYPQFFLSSATCNNAKEHAENLTGLEFVEVNASNRMRPQRDFVFVKPKIPSHKYWDILQLRTGLACVARGKQVLAFCPTRKFAENCCRSAKRELKKNEETGNPICDESSVEVFKAGLATSKRQEIQERLKSGEVKLVFATNALEMGIDIGGLDGIIIAGFPDNMMSAWQRIGRAGRSWNTKAFVLYFARNNPLDYFYVENLETFLHKPLDDLVVNPENEDLVKKHLASLLCETPELNNDAKILGQSMVREVREEINNGIEPCRTGNYKPHMGLDIRGGGGAGMFILKDNNDKNIGSISQQQQFREAYPHAIYMHGGHNYRVKDVTSGGILLKPADPWLQTYATTYKNVNFKDIFSGLRWKKDNSEISISYGKVLITEAISSIHEIDERTDEKKPLPMPKVDSAEFKSAHAFAMEAQMPQGISPEGINAFQHLFRIGALFSIPLDAHDVFPHQVHKDQTVYVIESYPGGIGIAKKTLERWKDVLKTGFGIAEKCRCKTSCPNCIMPPREKDDMNKMEALQLASDIFSVTSEEATHEFHKGNWKPITSK